MFFSHSSHKKHSSPIISFFRLILTVVVFGFMMGGLYMAFQSFSGVDPMTINPTAVINLVLSSRDPKEIVQNLSKLDLNTIVQVAQSNPTDPVLSVPQQEVESSKNPPKTVAYSFILVADSHSENGYLKKALEQGKSQASNLAFIIGLGDYTEVGTIEELKAAKLEFDSVGIRYFLIPGDHDLWDSRDKQKDPLTNFNSFFGASYQSFTYQNTKFILINNADNYTGIDQKQQSWIENELSKAKSMDNASLVFAFMHEPLYHPSSTHIMGRVTDDLKNQPKNLIMRLQSGGVNEVFSGDLHFFSRFIEPQFKLNMTTLGAVTSNRNTQSPRFAIVSVYDDGTYGVEDVEIR